MPSITCPQCGGETLRGDVRSGVLSFGAFFIEHDEKRTFTGAPKMKGHLQRDNRVISIACTRCGLISSYLERVLRQSGK